MAGENRTLTVRLVGNSRGATQAIGQTVAATGTLQSKVSRVGDTLRSTGSRITGMGAKLTGVSVAALYFVNKVGAPYQQSLNKIQALSDSNDQTMKRVAKTLESSAPKYAKLGMTSGDAADGVVELVKAGMSLDDAMKSVNSTLVLAKAGELGVADSAALVSNALNVFKTTGLKAGDAANILANAANISSADVSDLGQSLQMVSNVAASAGADFKTTNAMLAELSNAGMKGSDAGTSLKTMLLSLQAPSATAAKGLEAVGVSVFNAQGKMRPILDVIGDLDKKFANLSDEERATRLKQIFGSDAYRAANVIFGNGAKELQKYIKGVDKAGAANKLAESNSKGLAGQLAKSRAQFTSLAQSMYRQFSPAVEEVLKKVGGFAAKLSQASPNMKKWAAILGVAALAAGPLLLILGGLVSAIGALLSPIGLVIAAIVAIGAGFAVAYAKSEAFRNGVSKFIGALKPIFSGLVGVVKSLIPVVVDLGKQFAAKIGPALAEVGALVTSKLLPAIQKILPVITPIAKFLLKMFGAALMGAVSGVIQVVKGVIQVVSGVVNFIDALIHGRWSEAWHALVDIVKGVLNIIIGAFKVWWNVGVMSLFKQGFKALVNIFKSAWKGIVKLAKGGINMVNKVLAGVVRVITLPFRKSFSAVSNYVKTGWAFIRGNFSKGVSGIRAVLGRIIQVITYPYRNAFRIAKSIVTGAWRTLRSNFSTGVSNLMSALRNLPSRISGVFRNAGSWLWNAGKNIIEGLLRGITSMIGQVQDKLRSLTNMLPDWKGPESKDKRILQPAGEHVMGGFMDGLQNRFGAVRSMLGGFTDSLGGSFGRSPALAGVPVPGRGGYLSAGGAQAPVVVQIQVEGNVIGEKDFAKRILPTVREGLRKVGNRNGGRVFGDY